MFNVPLILENIDNVDNQRIKDMYTVLVNMVEQVNQGVSMIDRDGIVVLWNDFMEKKYNIPAEEYLGKKMSDYLEDTISERSLNTKMPMSDIYYSHKNNEDKDLFGYVYACPVCIEGEFVGVVCTEFDALDARKLSKELAKTKDKIRALENEVRNLSNSNFDNILGKSRAILKAKNIAKQVSKTNSIIVINGEIGTGKEVFARTIHRDSERHGAFITVNCSAIVQDLFENEFFGVVPGAMSGVSKVGKKGIFEMANAGTLFLDEISELPMNLQAKLLNVIKEKKILKIGAKEETRVDVRIIAASNKDLKTLVKEGKFREDLYYALNVIEINLPPLRERLEDVSILIYDFLEEQSKINNKPFLKISKDCFKVLEKYEWRGNIRELKNTIENMVVLSSNRTLDIDDIPEYILESVRGNKNIEIYPMDLNEAISRLEKNKIMEAISIAKGNKSKAAKILNIPRTTLYYKIENYELDV